MCWICKAGNKVRKWTNFSQCADWRGTERSHAEYLAEVAAKRVQGGPTLSNVFLIDGFVLEGVVIDVMHCLDLGFVKVSTLTHTNSPHGYKKYLSNIYFSYP